MPWSLNAGTGKGSQIIIEHCTYVCIDASVASFSLSPQMVASMLFRFKWLDCWEGRVGDVCLRIPACVPGPHLDLGDAHHACVSVSFYSWCPCLVTRFMIKNDVHQSEEGGWWRTSGHFAHVRLHVSKCFQSGHKYSTVPPQFQYNIMQALAYVMCPKLSVNQDK